MKICVTGGAGSIGSNVVRALIARGDDVRVADISEEGLWSLKIEIPDIDARLCDVASAADVKECCRGVDSVIHCAAAKHVDLVERSPKTAHAINIGGTLNVLGLLEGGELEHVVFLSTDKAIRPMCEMGRQKLQAEMAALQFGAAVVRFGNVIGSRGSLIPAVRRMRELGRPITLTHAGMTRFFMTEAEATRLVLKALDARVSSAFVPQTFRSCRIGDFVRICRDLFAPGHEINETGIRDGERMHEYAITPTGEYVRSDDRRYLMTEPAIESFLAGLYDTPRVVARLGA